VTAADREHWDEVYRQRDDEPLPPPDPLLLQFTPPVAAGQSARALDLAGGLGQNGLWLASQGYRVDVLDISRVALERAQSEASARRLRQMNFYLVDLDQITLDVDTYDLICVFRFLKRDLFPPLRAAARAGARVVYQTFTVQRLNTQPDANPDYLLRPGELAGYFADWKLVHKDEYRDIAQLVALKAPRA
jgi:hypothetical protein